MSLFGTSRGRPAFVGLAVAAVVVSSFAVAPSAVAEDSPEAVVGELTRTWLDGVPEQESGPLSWVRTDTGDRVRIPTEDVQGIDVGSRVRVTLGRPAQDEASTERATEPARDVLAAATLEAPVTAAATPTKSVTVVRVVPQGGRQDGTALADIVAQVNGPVHDYWAEQSNGNIALSATGWPDWVTVAAGCSDGYAIVEQAAAAVGFVEGPGRHLLVYLPDHVGELTGCRTGFAEEGADASAGGMAYVKGMTTSRIAHQLGHNFGLGDSMIMRCTSEDGSVAFVEDGHCASSRHDDYYDVMGDNPDQLGSLSALQAGQLGFAEPSSEQVVVAGRDPMGGTIRLLPLGGRTGLRSVQLVVPSQWVGEEPVRYWLEYRTATGQDAWLGDARNAAGLQTGVLLRRLAREWGDLSWLHDASPTVDGDMKVALPVGVPVHAARGGFTVTVDAADSDGATVRVTLDPPRWLSRDWTGDGRSDLMAVDGAGRLWTYPGNGSGGLQPRRSVGMGWQARDGLVMAGDMNENGTDDLIARNPSNGDLWYYDGDGTGGFVGWMVSGRGWNIYNAIFSPGDWNGDGLTDLIARQRSDGALFLYRDSPGGLDLHPRTKIGSGWNVMADLVSTGDWDGNGIVDFAARDTAGDLYLYSGNGAGGFSGRKKIGAGWQVFSQITSPGDLNGDGAADIVAVHKDGRLFRYPGDGTGGFLPRTQLGSGWTGYRLFD